MRRWWIKFALFSAPLGVLSMFPLWVLIASCELWPVAEVVATQRTSDVLFGLAYRDITPLFKLESALDRRADVLALGTSRVMQLRASFFKGDVTFYNAGGGVRRLKHFREFLAKVPPGNQPKIVILGLDQDFFNASLDDARSAALGSELEPKGRIATAVEAYERQWRQIISDYWDRKFTIRQLRDRAGRHIGLTATIHEDGFRQDGSYRYGRAIRSRQDGTDAARFADAMDRVTNGLERFQRSSEIRSGALGELADLLRYCNDRGIYAVGFLPPFAHVIHAEMTASGAHGFLTELPEAIQPLFAQHRFGFYDFSDLAWLDATDREAIDGFHGSEKAYLRIMIRMAASDPRIASVTSTAYLQARLAASRDDYEVHVPDVRQ